MNLTHCVFVSPVCPDSSGSGLEQRAFHLLAELAAQHNVTLVLAAPTPLSIRLRGRARQLAAQIFDVRTTSVSGMAERLALLLPVLPWLFASLAAGWLRVDNSAQLPTLPDEISAFVVFRLRTHSVARRLFADGPSPQRTMLDMDDHESATLWSIGVRALLRKRLRFALRTLGSAIQLFGLERQLLRRYGRIAYANPADRAALSRLVRGRQELLLWPNRVDIAVTSNSRARAPSPVFTALFIGTLSYFPNEDAALWIAEAIVPQLRRRFPAGSFRVLIAGRNASDRIRAKLECVDEVTLLGYVENLESLYAQSDVALVAVRCGGGTKVKLLEAVAHRCPVTATPHSLRGLPFSHPAEVLCAEDAHAFADQCAFIRKTPDAAAKMAGLAYARLMGS